MKEIEDFNDIHHQEILFNEWIDKKHVIQGLVAIIQNPIKPVKKDINAFSEQYKSFIKDLEVLYRETYRFLLSVEDKE